MRTLRIVLALVLAGCGLLSLYVFHWFRDRYSGRGPMPHTMRWILHAPVRRFIHPVRPMLDLFGLRSGMTVLELGPGNGYFSIGAARLLGAGGRLVCLDIQRATSAAPPASSPWSTSGVSSASP